MLWFGYGSEKSCLEDGNVRFVSLSAEFIGQLETVCISRITTVRLLNTSRTILDIVRETR